MSPKEKSAKTYRLWWLLIPAIFGLLDYYYQILVIHTDNLFLILLPWYLLSVVSFFAAQKVGPSLKRTIRFTIVAFIIAVFVYYIYHVLLVALFKNTDVLGITRDTSWIYDVKVLVSLFFDGFKHWGIFSLFSGVFMAVFNWFTLGWLQRFVAHRIA